MLDNKPFFSVVIPMYNAEKYISDCLDSILSQTFYEIEIVVVDDGSADSSGDICKAYADKDKRVCYFRKENGGSFQSRLYGAERTHGVYVMFCDSDDIYTENSFFAKLYKKLQNEEYDVLQFGYCAKYNNLVRKFPIVDAVIDVSRDEFLAQEYPNVLCSHWGKERLKMSLWNKVYHHKMLENLPNGNIGDRIFWGDDLITNLHLLENCNRLCMIPDIGYCYRVLTGGTTRFNKREMSDLDNIKKYQLLFLERYQGESKEEIRKILFNEVADWMFSYIQRAIESVGEQEALRLTEEALVLPNFVVAKDYYEKYPEEKSLVIDLLRQNDAQQYLMTAKRYAAKGKLKKKLIQCMKKVYSKI